jgi:hypothetical protein
MTWWRIFARQACWRITRVATPSRIRLCERPWIVDHNGTAKDRFAIRFLDGSNGTITD